MYKKSILLQMFRSITIIIAIVFFIQFLIQVLFLKPIFINYKLSNIKNSYYSLSKDLQNIENEYQIINIINNFSKKTNTYNNFLNFNQNILFSDENLLKIEVSTESEILFLYTLPFDCKLENNDIITFQGFKNISNNSFLANYVNINNKNMYGELKNNNTYKNIINTHINNYDYNILYTYTGKINNIIYPQEIISYENKIILNEILQLSSKNKIYEVNDNNLNIKYYISKDNIFFLNKFTLNNESYELITVYSLNSFHDILRYFTIFNSIMICILFIISSIITLLKSIRLSKPIRKLNELTSNYAYLNIKEDISFESDDEIQSIADSFKKLLTQLENNNQRINEQNKRLYDLINTENKNEIIRINLLKNLGNELIQPFSNILDIINNNQYNENIMTIKNNINYCHNTINDLVLISQINNTSFKENYEAFDLKIIIEKVFNDLSENILSKKIILQLDLNSYYVYGDKSRMYMALNYLIVNSIRYAKENNFLHIYLKEENKKILFTLENLNTYISEDRINLLFQPCNIMDKIINRNEDSSFLSMYIVKLILDQHDADFGIYNSKNGVIYFFKMNKYDIANII